MILPIFGCILQKNYKVLKSFKIICRILIVFSTQLCEYFIETRKIAHTGVCGSSRTPVRENQRRGDIDTDSWNPKPNVQQFFRTLSQDVRVLSHTFHTGLFQSGVGTY